MSKKTKTARKNKRLEERRRAKAARYARHKEQIKGRVRKKQKIMSTISHPAGKCGNPACEKCFGITFSRAWFVNGKPVGMPQRMYQRWFNQKAA